MSVRVAAARAGGMVCPYQMPVPGVRAGVVSGAAFGVSFEMRVDDARLLPAVRERLPPGWTHAHRPPAVVLSLVHEVSDTSSWTVGTSPRRAGAGRRSRQVYGLSVRVDGQPVARGLSHAQALDVLESELQISVARLASPEVFVHAGVVAVGGRAILLPGRSGAGKTTLVRALVDAGATYYSDEYAVLDPDGRVRPYPRRPSVRLRGGHKERHPVPRGRGRLAVPVGLIVETRYRPGARWAPAALSPGECVLVLLANTVPARDRPGEVLAALARATAGARGLRSDRGAAGRTARTLIALAGQLGAASADGARATKAVGARPRSGRRKAISVPEPRSGRAPPGRARAPRRRPPPRR